MKIRLSELRKLIREAVESDLEEMALASIGKTTRDPRNKSGQKGTFDKPETDEDYRKIDRFHQTPKYKKGLEKSLEGISVPVHVIPVYTVKSALGSRTRVMKFDDVAQVISKAGYDPEEMRKKVAAGESVILSNSRELVKGFLPFSTTLIHAFFDDGGNSPPANAALEVVRHIGDLINGLKDAGIGTSDAIRGLYSTLSVFSAVQNLIGLDAVTDWAAELCTDAVRKGTVKPREYKNDKLPQDQINLINKAGKDLYDFINGLGVRKILEDYLRGKVVSVDTANILDF